MQNNILLPNSNVAPLTGMSKPQDSKSDINHNIPENDPHFQDSGLKKGLLNIKRKVGLGSRKSSISQSPLEEHPILQASDQSPEGSSTQSNSHPNDRQYYRSPNQVTGSMSAKALKKDQEDARIRRASMQG
ncbi:hypothetical protein TWF106_002129 [Orbilia oligospora]|uniref:Uncharacterized protein n=1 Tax=Orbilia oligospora TaxID=2813651 RepID=A0A6G1M1M4_ORBOL|nr:hypothetical protein TWF788_010422 [Orbilia oligospora]KAF3202733.1 hypothetical protein TWF679_010694 [Orbilia oligospora]KAF3225611.1 hypothetical protein TWF106_002129 [Orbilia oligospora]KAF3226209.1 hypothetical protein TWF191_004870 [Orbilia oligospora]KAF3241814.1 hypothetical protein TWF192_008827 [Orbilia oligospora]